MHRGIKTLITLAIFSLIGVMLRTETIEFLFAANLATTSNIGLLDLTVNLFTSPIISVYFLLPLSFSMFYLFSLQNDFAEEYLSICLIRYNNRDQFLWTQFRTLFFIILKYLFYLLSGSIIIWMILGHRISEFNYHYVFDLAPTANIKIIFILIMVYIVLGLIMIGLITLLLFLIFKHIFIVLFAILGLSLLHSISYTIGFSDTLTALLPFSQFSSASSNLFYPFGLSVEWFTPVFQLSYLVLSILLLLFLNLKMFKRYEV